MKKIMMTILSAPLAGIYMAWLDGCLLYCIYRRKIKLALLHLLHIILWIMFFTFIIAKATEPITGTF
jgi:hypothetical protein